MNEPGARQRFHPGRGGFTAEAANVVAEADLRTLVSLLDQSLLQVQPEGDRYNLHELLRQYAEEQLGNSGSKDAVHAAHSAYFTGFMVRAWGQVTGGGQVAMLHTIDVEFENLRVAWRYLTEHGSPTEFRYFIESLWFYLNVRDQPQEAISLFGQTIDRLRSWTPSPATDVVVGHLLARQGWFFTHSGIPEQGKTLIEQGMSILRQHDCPRELLAALHSLAHTSAYLPDRTALRQAAEEGLHIAHEYGYSWEGFNMLYWLAFSHFDEPAEAKRIGDLCLKQAEAAGDVWLSAYASAVILARAARRDSNYDEIQQRSEYALPRFKDIDELLGLALCHENLGMVAYSRGNYAEAEHHYHYALKYRHASSVRIRIETARPIALLVEVWIAQNRLEPAVELLAAAADPIKPNPIYQSLAEKLAQQLQDRLDRELYDRAWKRGQLKTLEIAIAEVIASAEAAHAPAKFPMTRRQVNQHLTNPLTEREYEILMQVVEGSSNQDIASRLYLSLNTVRSHLKHVYSKLGVDSRTRAMTYLRDLGLL